MRRLRTMMKMVKGAVSQLKLRNYSSGSANVAASPKTMRFTSKKAYSRSICMNGK